MLALKQPAESVSELVVGILDKDGILAGVRIEDLHCSPEDPGVRTAKRCNDGSQLNPVLSAGLVEHDIEERRFSGRDSLHVASYDDAGLVEKHQLDLDRSCV